MAIWVLRFRVSHWTPQQEGNKQCSGRCFVSVAIPEEATGGRKYSWQAARQRLQRQKPEARRSSQELLGCQFRSQSAGPFIECPQESIGREANPLPRWLHGKHLWSSPTFTAWHCLILSPSPNILKRHLPAFCMQIFLCFWCLSCVPLFLFCFLPVTFTSSLSDLSSLKNTVLVAFTTYLWRGLQVLNIGTQKPPRKLTTLKN